MIRPEDVRLERHTDHRRFSGGTVLRARIPRAWGTFVSDYEASLDMDADEFMRRQEERLRSAVLREVYGGIADPLRVVEMALRILLPAGPASATGPYPPGALQDAMTALQAYADAGQYAGPAPAVVPRLPQDMEAEPE